MADRPTHLEIKGWKEFQHYKDRRPPWIKLYASLLDDVAFLQLPEAAQAQLLKLWVLASQFGHPLPNDPKMLAGKIGVQKKFYLADIIAAGFIIPCYRDASAALAESSENARPLVQRAESREREQSSEERQNPLPTEARVLPLPAKPAGAPAPSDARPAAPRQPSELTPLAGTLSTVMRAVGDLR